jgi:hypothetical protein
VSIRFLWNLFSLQLWFADNPMTDLSWGCITFPLSVSYPLNAPLGFITERGKVTHHTSPLQAGISAPAASFHAQRVTPLIGCAEGYRLRSDNQFCTSVTTCLKW